MNKLKPIFVGVSTLILPSFLSIFILKMLGIKVGQNVKIGFSFIKTKNILIEDNVTIGHLNIILNDEIVLKKETIIGYLNILKGPFKLILEKKAAIGNKNYFTRAKLGVSYGNSVLKLGELTKVTVNHHLDLTRSITFGDFSILAGKDSQIWTHGYYHENEGKGRIRIDGEILIGNNVYVGSSCIFNPGVKVSDAIHIGGGSVISKDLTEKGMYVSQAIRHIKTDIDQIKNRLTKIDDTNLIEEVYTK